jgi:hypothetical protein
VNSDYITYNWTMNGMEVSDSQFLSITGLGTGVHEFLATGSNPLCYTSDSIEITVSTTAPVAIINTPDGTETCGGNVIHLESSETGNITWYLEGNLVGNQPLLEVTSSGEYTMTIDNGCGTASSSVVISVADSPEAIIHSNSDFNICADEVLMIWSDYEFGNSWFFNGYFLSNEPALESSQIGEFELLVSNGICSDSTTVIVESAEEPWIQIIQGDSISFCESETQELSISTNCEWLSWWLGQDQYLGMEELIEINNAGVYTVFGSNDCGYNSDSIFVEMFNSPEASFSISGNLFTAVEAISYQWYIDGDLIPGAESQLYEALVTGTYMLLVTNEHGCSGISEEIFHIVNDVPVTGNDEMPTIFPNPAGESCTIYLPITGGSQLLTLLDESGRIVWQYQGIEKTISLPAEKFSPGVYVLRWSDNGETSHSKLVVN